MKVSVVTPNYNGVKFLKNYFNSLNQDSECIGEVIIIDNGSDDSSLEYIQKNNFNFPVVVIKNDENLGFAHAVNQGISKAKYDYIFSLNNDTEVEIGSINAMLDLIQEEDIFSVQAKMIQSDNKQLIDDAGDEYNLLAWTKKVGENQNSENYSQVLEIFSSCAGAALYKKSIIKEIGYFDTEFFAYMEDVDIAYRAQIYGYKNYYCPNAIVYHIGSGSSGSQYNEFKIPLAARNNVWMIYKNFPIPQKIFNFPFIFLGFLIKYLFFKKKGFGSLYLKGVKEGLNSRGNIQKTKYKLKHSKNYFKIEWKLIKNTFRLIKNK